MTTQAPQDQAQLTWAHTLRPFPAFADAYDGVSAAEWIMLQEGDNPLDANAGDPGYSPTLLRGLPVPPGARIQLWLPHIYTNNADTSKIEPYSYHLMYRFRNLTEYQTKRGGWHLVTSEGVTDTTPVTGGVRTLKPACYRSFAIQQAEPAPPPGVTFIDREIFHLRPSDVQPYSGQPPALPLVPDPANPGMYIRGVVQQGVINPVTFGNVPAGMPGYDVVNDVTLGDELLLGLSRGITNTANYDFSSTDFTLLSFFATSPNVGIFVLIGKVPSGQNSYA